MAPLVNLTALGITTGEQLEEYVCKWTINGTDVNYVSFCPWPYTFKGWGDDGDPGFNDTVFGDCSLNMAESFDSTATIRLVYMLLAFLLTLWSARNLKVLMDKRAASKKKDVVPTSETLARIMLWCCVDHFLITCDSGGELFWGYNLLSLLQGAFASSLAVMMVILVTSWVSVIDGGKAKTTPPWIIKAGRISMFCFVFGESVGSVVEINVGGAEEDGGAFYGPLNAIKGLAFAINMIIWACICFHYFNKINKQLSGGGSSDGAAGIKKMIRAVLVAVCIASVYKAFFGFLRLQGGIMYSAPPCAASAVNVISVMFGFIQVVCLVSQNPATPKKANRVAASTTTTTTTASEGA